MSMDYVTAFSVSDHPFRNWWFPAFGLIFVSIGFVLVRWPDLLVSVSRYKFQRSSLFRWSFFLFGSAWTVGVATTTAVGSYRAVEALRSGKYQTVEGRVSNFVPMPYQGHADESFEVNGVRFSYSDYVITSGFNQSSSHGGPIKEGLPVRIAYRNGEILKLEIAY
jgi:hypothetical protein